MPRNDWRPLIEARYGRPTEKKAVDIIAVYSAIPAAIAGMLVGAMFVPQAAGFGELCLIAGGAAVATVTVVLLAIFATYKAFGFRPIVMLADAMAGAIIGMFVGGVLSKWADFPFVFVFPPLGAATAVVVGMTTYTPPPPSADDSSTPSPLPE